MTNTTKGSGEMFEALIGKKLGMTQIFAENGKAEPVTVIEIGPCTVVQVKTEKTRDKYNAVQLGYDEKREKITTKPIVGHHKKHGSKPHRLLKEVSFSGDIESLKPGTVVGLKDVPEVDKVSVTGIGKGKGFQGVVRRYGFRGGRSTHGSKFHRAPGSIGASAWPSRVIKGKKLPGRMGGKAVTISGLKIIKRDPDKNLLAVRGAVPGRNGGYVIVRFS